MKKTFAAAFAVTLSFAVLPMMAKADTVTLEGVPYYSGAGGGEFTAYTSPSFVGHYSSLATFNNGTQTGFETFCLETGIHVSLGSTYTFTLGLKTTPLSPVIASAGQGLDLSQGAAWLYEEFGSGLLGNYAYSTTIAARQADDLLLQSAIWFLQGGQSYGSYPFGGVGNKFYDDAVTALGANVDAAYTGNEVRVMQLWDANGDAIQNQIVLVPDGGATVVLLGAGLLGMGFVYRRFAVSK